MSCTNSKTVTRLHIHDDRHLAFVIALYTRTLEIAIANQIFMLRNTKGAYNSCALQLRTQICFIHPIIKCIHICLSKLITIPITFFSHYIYRIMGYLNTPNTLKNCSQYWFLLISQFLSIHVCIIFFVLYRSNNWNQYERERSNIFDCTNIRFHCLGVN